LPRPIGVVQKPGLFEDILTRLGVNRPGQPFMLDGDIVPVILVDSGIAFTAAPTPPYAVTDIFTEGIQSSPPINTVLATTGPLPVGSYTMQFVMEAREQGSFGIEWRNATDTGNLAVIVLSQKTTFGTMMWESRFQIVNASERFRVINLGVGGALYSASILARI